MEERGGAEAPLYFYIERGKNMSIRSVYDKERNRVRNLLNRMEKQGYLGARELLPPIPKRVTRGSVSRLSKITRESVAAKTMFANRETGEVVSGKLANIRIKQRRDPFTPFKVKLKNKIKISPKKEKRKPAPNTFRLIQKYRKQDLNLKKKAEKKVLRELKTRIKQVKKSRLETWDYMPPPQPASNPSYEDAIIDNMYQTIIEALNVDVRRVNTMISRKQAAITQNVLRSLVRLMESLKKKNPDQLADNIDKYYTQLMQSIDGMIYPSDWNERQEAKDNFVSYISEGF